MVSPVPAVACKLAIVLPEQNNWVAEATGRLGTLLIVAVTAMFCDVTFVEAIVTLPLIVPAVALDATLT